MVEPIGYNKKKAKEVLNKYDIDLLIASTPVNVFYTTGLPVTHVAPNPILYVLSNQYPFFSMVRRDGEESALIWSLYDSVEQFSWLDPSEVIRIGSLNAAINLLLKKVEEWELNDKTIGIIIGSVSEKPLRPIIKIIIDQKKQRLTNTKIINLLEETSYYIVRALDENEVGLNIFDVL